MGTNWSSAGSGLTRREAIASAEAYVNSYQNYHVDSIEYVQSGKDYDLCFVINGHVYRVDVWKNDRTYMVDLVYIFTRHNKPNTSPVSSIY